MARLGKLRQVPVVGLIQLIHALGGIRFLSVDTPPAPILEAALYTLHLALVFARNGTLQHTPEAVKQANDLMEAIHEIPIMLSHWSRHDVSVLRMHFGCYHTARWPDHSPDLVRIFDTKLAELSS